MEHIRDRDPDVVFLSETWLTSEENHVTALVKTYGYKLLHNRRKNRQKETGSGVGTLIRTSMIYKHMKTKTYSSFELTMVKVFIKNKKSILLLSISRVLFESITVFLEELIQLFTMLMTSNECIIFAGDVNKHTETDESSSKQFKDILDILSFPHTNLAIHWIVLLP